MLAGDLGGTSMRVAVFDAHGAGGEHRRARTPPGDPDAIIHLARAALAATSSSPSAFVLGVPGPVSYVEGRPFRLPNLPGWEGRLTAQSLADAIGVPVLIANDADLGALGEHRAGAGRGTADMLYVTVSTGVGAGVILNGRLLHGRRSLAELGWTTVDRHAGTTVEENGSGTALARLTGLDGAAAVERARAGDPRALAAFADVAGVLAVAVMNAILCFMPERVVIGGGVAGAGELLLGPIREHVARTGVRMAITPDIVVAAGGDDVGLRGAFALWQDVERGTETLAYAWPGGRGEMAPGSAERR
ncbi:MAG: ROK family protein [Dehalococcoidia bacterium]